MKKKLVPIFVLFFLLSTSFNVNSYPEKERESTKSDGGLMDSAWPMKCHDKRHTSQSEYSTENNPGAEIWRFRSDDAIEAGPVIGPDGTIYVGDFDRYVYAINPNGTEKWRYKTGGWIESTPALSQDCEIIFVTSWDDYLYALYTNNGTLKWKFAAEDSVSSSPVIGDDGTIYFGTLKGFFTDSKIFAVNPNGTKKWRFITDDAVYTDPAIGFDGTIYAGSCDSGLYALYPNGTLRWRFQTDDHIHGHPSIGLDGTIYTSSNDDYFYAINPNGTLKWRTHTTHGTSGSAAVASDGILYIGTNKLYAIYPNNGTIKWELDVGGTIDFSSPAISADGTIYVTAGQRITAVNPDGTEKWTIGIGITESSPAIGADGTIYVGSSQSGFGYLHAIGRGPFSVDAGGPYSGTAGQSIYFDGTVFGGIPPYDYVWDWGDGNFSYEENPHHTYAMPGEYVATFSVTDDEGNFSFDTANVTIYRGNPTVSITRPENALYLFNLKLFQMPMPWIIGKIKIVVDAHQIEIGINRVEFYIDNELRFTDYDAPYEWIWNEHMFSKHQIKVVAVDDEEKSTGVSVEVRKFF